jgi:thioredoxin reductase (NADPH)
MSEAVHEIQSAQFEAEVLSAPEPVVLDFCMVPRTELLKGVVPLDRWGCVETDDSMQTSVPGLFAAGDIRVKKFRQITTAVADGTIAALAAQKYLREAR